MEWSSTLSLIVFLAGGLIIFALTTRRATIEAVEVVRPIEEINAERLLNAGIGIAEEPLIPDAWARAAVVAEYGDRWQLNGNAHVPHPYEHVFRPRDYLNAPLIYPIEAYGEKVRDEASDRARELLLQNLSPEQKATFLENGFFYVICGPNKERRYKITYGVSYNVYLDGRAFCAYPPGVPVYDVMLSQKIALETDEAKFILTANLARDMVVPGAYPGNHIIGYRHEV